MAIFAFSMIGQLVHRKRNGRERGGTESVKVHKPGLELRMLKHSYVGGLPMSLSVPGLLNTGPMSNTWRQGNDLQCRENVFAPFLFFTFFCIFVTLKKIQIIKQILILHKDNASKCSF